MANIDPLCSVESERMKNIVLPPSLNHDIIEWWKNDASNREGESRFNKKKKNTENWRFLTLVIVTF